MKVSGFDIMDALERVRQAKSEASAAFSENLFRYPVEGEKTSSSVEEEAAEKAVETFTNLLKQEADLVALQHMFNGNVYVDDTTSLAETIFWHSAYTALEHLWADAEKDRGGSFLGFGSYAKDKDKIYQERTLSKKRCKEEKSYYRAKKRETRANIRKGNATYIEIPDKHWLLFGS